MRLQYGTSERSDTNGTRYLCTPSLNRKTVCVPYWSILESNQICWVTMNVVFYYFFQNYFPLRNKIENIIDCDARLAWKKLFKFLCPHYIRRGVDLDLTLSVLPSENSYFCDKCGKVGASMTYGHISSLDLFLMVCLRKLPLGGSDCVNLPVSTKTLPKERSCYYCFQACLF